MTNIDIFGDNRKIPSLSINVKIKANTISQEEAKAWDKVFGYVMKKPRTKLEFLAVNKIRELSLNTISVQQLKPYLNEEDYEQLLKIENLFTDRLTADIKAFILAILKVSPDTIKSLNN